MVTADVAFQTCTERFAAYDYDPSEARSHLPDVLRHEFSSSGCGSHHRSFQIRGAHPFFTSSEDECFWVHVIQHTGDETFSCVYERITEIYDLTNGANPDDADRPTFVEVTYSSDQIVDWQVIVHENDTRTYGAFLIRHLTETGQRNIEYGLQLMPNPLPPRYTPSPLFGTIEE